MLAETASVTKVNTMKRYDQVLSIYQRDSDNRDHWLVLEGVDGWGNHYETDHLAVSNWEYCVRELQADDTIGCEIHNKLILIHPWRKDLRDIATDIERSLDGYPVLDDDDFSQREFEDIESQWECWGYSDLFSEVTKHLSPFGDTDCDSLEADSYELRRLIEDKLGHGLIECRDSYFSRIEDVLARIPTPEIWEHITSVEIDKASFDALGRDVFLVIHNKGIVVKDYHTGEPLQVPDYIALHYNNPQQPNLL